MALFALRFSSDLWPTMCTCWFYSWTLQGLPLHIYAVLPHLLLHFWPKTSRWVGTERYNLKGPKHLLNSDLTFFANNVFRRSCTNLKKKNNYLPGFNVRHFEVGYAHFAISLEIRKERFFSISCRLITGSSFLAQGSFKIGGRSGAQQLPSFQPFQPESSISKAACPVVPLLFTPDQFPFSGRARRRWEHTRARSPTHTYVAGLCLRSTRPFIPICRESRPTRLFAVRCIYWIFTHPSVALFECLQCDGPFRRTPHISARARGSQYVLNNLQKGIL